ncbi:MAG: cell division protein FtsQ/DivIB [Proteobacteria bacterium]|nr:cell division protein FtsQ/DivIB [Pseudomonadota bacterium]
MRKTFLFWAAFAFAIIIATYLSVRLTMLVMGRGGFADIRAISVSSRNGAADKSAIAAAIGISPRTPTYRVKLGDVLARISAIPDIDAASVRRMPNGTLKIKVQMRTAIAAWTDGTHYYPIGADGTKINRPSGQRPENSLVFRGDLPNDLGGIAGAVTRAPKIMAELNYLEWTDGRRWDLALNSGVIVKLPENNAEGAIRRLAELDKKTDILARDIRVLDLRDPERTFVK